MARKVDALKDMVVFAKGLKARRVTMNENLGLRQTSWSLTQQPGMLAKQLSARLGGQPGDAGTRLYGMIQARAVQ